MVYRRTNQVVKRLAARRSAILAAARDAAADGGMAAVQMAPVASRANVAAGTVYRYFPSKSELISELIAEVSRDELAAIRRGADPIGRRIQLRGKWLQIVGVARNAKYRNLLETARPFLYVPLRQSFSPIV